MAGPLTDRQRSSEYYRIAYKCAEVKNSKKGCDGNCAACVLNVHLYVDDPRDATLIKTSAAMDYGKWVAIQHDRNVDGWLGAIGSWLLLVLVIAAFVLPVQCVIRSCKKPTSPVPEVTTTTDDELFNAAYYAKNNLRDVNNDGLKDCIDYALLYKSRVPRARLIWNLCKYPVYWSHLFVQVDGVYIEPSAAEWDMYKRRIEYWFRVEYNPANNKDMTNYEYSIRNNTIYWNWEMY
jgi:hypothetical protein